MPAAFVVIGKKFDDFTLPPDLEIALSVLKGLRQIRVGIRADALKVLAKSGIVPRVLREESDNDDRDKFFHRVDSTGMVTKELAVH